MTKSKCITKEGKVERINLRPTKHELFYGYSTDTFGRRVAKLKAKGYTLKNRSMT